MPPSFLILIGGVLAILIGATLVARNLRARSDGPSDVFDNLTARINAWWVMVALLAGAMLLGPTAIVGLFALLSAAALREFLPLTTQSRADRLAIVALWLLALPITYLAIWSGWYGFFAIFVPIYGFLFLAVASVAAGETENYLLRVSEVHWAMFVCIYAVAHVPALLLLHVPGYPAPMLLIAWLIFVVQFSDVSQYVWGKLFGRRKIAPRLSPSKTWEGFVGGIATASLLGMALFWVTPFGPLQALGMALIVTLMGFFGGLVMSAVKRDKGIKDWGHIVPGHGGVIDRLDSLIFSAPLFFHLTRFFWNGQ
jgi:phosphatidate cytidylyltransferase